MDKIFIDLSEWIKEQIIKAIDKLVDLRLQEYNSRLLTKEEVADKLGMNPTTFDRHYRYMPGFPKELPACRWSLPAINEWIANQK